MSGEEGGELMGKATVARTRSGALRGSVDPQALARELETLRARVTAMEHALAPAFGPRPRPRLDLDAGPPRQSAPQQASVTTGEWGARHDPRVVAAYGSNVFPAVLHAVEAEQARQATERHKDSDVMWRPRVWCGKAGCRPASPCASCAGHRTVLRDGSVTGGPPVQASAYPGNAFWDRFPDHQIAPQPGPPVSGSVWDDGPASDFTVARQHAATMPPRPPAGDGDILKGL